MPIHRCRFSKLIAIYSTIDVMAPFYVIDARRLGLREAVPNMEPKSLQAGRSDNIPAIILPSSPRISCGDNKNHEIRIPIVVAPDFKRQLFVDFILRLTLACKAYHFPICS